MAAMSAARYAAGLAVLLAACATQRWEKAGITPQAMEADLNLCETSAPLAPRPPAGPRAKPGSNVVDFNSASEREFDRMRKDDEHIAACMRAKGYSR